MGCDCCSRESSNRNVSYVLLEGLIEGTGSVRRAARPRCELQSVTLIPTAALRQLIPDSLPTIMPTVLIYQDALKTFLSATNLLLCSEHIIVFDKCMFTFASHD